MLKFHTFNKTPYVDEEVEKEEEEDDDDDKEEEEEEVEEVDDDDDDNGVGSDNTAGEDDKAHAMLNNSKVISKRKLDEDESGIAKKKLKAKSGDSRLYKPPTVKELNQLRETENLFHSNLFRLQIQEMLKEVKIKLKYKNLVQQWVEDFKKALDSFDDGQEYDLMDCKWLKQMKVKIPLPKLPNVAGIFRFVKPTRVSVFGSYGAGCCLGPNFTVDVNVEIPQACFDEKDYLNHKYQRKKAIYMAYIAGKLRSSNLVEEMHFSQKFGNPLTPVLEVKPKGKLNKRVLVVFHFSAASGAFKLSRFSPEKNNVRPNWYFDEEDKVEDKLPPTPHYNSSILKSLVIGANEEYCTKVLETYPSVKDGILLLKVWLKQRGLDQGYGCFSGYIMSMFVLYLLQSHRVNTAMSSYQIARNVWSHLAQSDWSMNGITLTQSVHQHQQNAPPTLMDFHRYFDVVFIDTTGYCNLCADMNKETFRQVKYECELAVKYLDNPNVNSFQALFMTPMPFYQQFDHIIRIQDADMIREIVDQHSPREQKLDHIGHVLPQALHLILKVLKKGLDHRVCHIGIMPSEVSQWPVNKRPPSSQEAITLGLVLNPDFAFSVLEKGPGANLPEALEFREFWGRRSEIRRFQDGSISEAVVWSIGSATLAQKRLICKEIVLYLLNEKLGVSSAGITYIADQLDSLLELKKFKAPGFDYGTGEEAAVRVIAALDSLGKQLREIEDIPLEVNSVLGTSPVFRYSDVFPPLAVLHKVPKEPKTKEKCFLLALQGANSPAPRWVPAIEAVMQLGLSGKWPSDLSAVQRIKAALYIKIAECLFKKYHLTAQPFPDTVQVLKDGYVFSLRVAHQHEIALLKETVTPEGVTKYRDNEESLALEKSIVHLPKLTSALHGLHQQYGSYGPTCCLAKRWLSSQLLDSFHIPEMCTELLVASLYLSPEPYQPPNQPQLGFFRFLQLLAHTNWNTEPVILNLNGEMNREDILEIETWFHSCRSVLPPLFLSTPYDKKNSVWTKEAPSLQILIRMAKLAEEALGILQSLIFCLDKLDWKQLFRPPLHIYDVLIHLIPHRTPRRFEAVDVKCEKSKYELEEYKYESGEKIPVVGFNPVCCLLSELRENYSEYALFFNDIYGGDIIGVVWKPSTLTPKDFRVSSINYHKLSKDGSKIELNIDAIIEDMYSLGSGVVSSIEVQSSSSNET